MSNLSWYGSLQPYLRECVERVLPKYKDDERVVRGAARLEKRHGRGENILPVAVLTSIPPRELLMNDNLGLVWCYHRTKRIILCLERIIISRGKNVRIVSCKDKPWVIKWFRKGSLTVEYETSIYRGLKKKGCPLPYFSPSYRFWNDPVLVLEMMEEIGKDDDYREMGCQVLCQLEHLHTFGVHNDIKPGNIMKRGEKYFLIDYGGVASERLEYGYRRWTWSGTWTSQKIHVKDQVTTHKNDLIELGYTLNALRKLSLGEGGDVRCGFEGEVGAYMDLVRKMDKRRTGHFDYSDLKNILKRGGPP